MGDEHLGPIHCDEDLLRETIKEIENDENARWGNVGDMADLITPQDFKRWDGAILADWLKGHENNIGMTQVNHAYELFKKIWCKCLFVLDGNHEADIRRCHSFDFTTNLREKIKENQGIDIPYGDSQAMIALKFRRSTKEVHQILIHARHGEGHARTSGARANAVLRLAVSFPTTHIILMGHLHGQEAPDIPQRLIYQSGKIKSYGGIATMTGAWLRAYMQNVPASYAERWGCTPSVLGCPRILIEPDKGKMTYEKVVMVREV